MLSVNHILTSVSSDFDVHVVFANRYLGAKYRHLFYVKEMTNNDAFAVSLISVAEFAPIFVFSFIGGTFADRWRPNLPQGSPSALFSRWASSSFEAAWEAGGYLQWFILVNGVAMIIGGLMAMSFSSKVSPQRLLTFGMEVNSLAIIGMGFSKDFDIPRCHQHHRVGVHAIRTLIDFGNRCRNRFLQSPPNNARKCRFS
jgi:hypothetical protein